MRPEYCLLTCDEDYPDDHVCECGAGKLTGVCNAINDGPPPVDFVEIRFIHRDELRGQDDEK